MFWRVCFWRGRGEGGLFDMGHFDWPITKNTLNPTPPPHKNR